MTPSEALVAQAVAAKARTRTRALEHLIGIVDGIVADGQLHDQEIQFLQTWLTSHGEVTEHWPGAAIARAVRDALADQVITQDERAHLMTILKQLASCDFSQTGSVSPEVCELPINDSVTVKLLDAAVCHTGTFAYGTRAAAERATGRAGGMPVDSVSRKTDFLVVGTMVTPSWKQSSFGRKIELAVKLQEDGHAIEIISEQRWLSALQPLDRSVG